LKKKLFIVVFNNSFFFFNPLIVLFIVVSFITFYYFFSDIIITIILHKHLSKLMFLMCFHNTLMSNIPALTFITTISLTPTPRNRCPTAP